jgi:hypothetical protein
LPLFNSFFGYFERLGHWDFAGVNNDHVLLWSIASAGFALLDGLDNVHAFQDLAEHNVAAVKPGRMDGSDEELGAVCVRTSVCHAEPSWSIMFQCEVLILKALSIDGLAASAIATGEITTLKGLCVSFMFVKTNLGS